MIRQIARGPLLNPRSDGRVDFHLDGVLVADDQGFLMFAGDWQDVADSLGGITGPVTHVQGVLTPPFLDIHTHVPQHPIRGHFADGLGETDPPEGRLLASLRRNVFPAEARWSDSDYAVAVAQSFLANTLAQGVVGGAAYLTVHAPAARATLRLLPPFWSAGLVLMNRHCPDDLRTDVAHLERDLHSLADEFGPRVIITDRFAVACDSPLRRRGAAQARALGLRTQTHLNEQRTEKAFVEQVLYPDCANYADVYLRDGLLDHRCILAHCLQMTEAEWGILADTGSVVAHCPTSNALLGSGVLALDTLHECRLPYALGTDVGASPTTSMLAEMAQFVGVHRGRSRHASPSEALWRATLAPAQILGLDHQLGSFDIGKPLSFIEIACDADLSGLNADGVIARILGLPNFPEPSLQAARDHLAATGLEHGPDLTLLTQDAWETARRLEGKVRRVVLAGNEIFRA